MLTVMVLGQLIRVSCIWTDNFWSVTIGTFLSNLANPFFVNVQSIIVNKWFTDKERALATAIQIIAMPLGSAISFAMSIYWFRDITEPDEFLTTFKYLMVV